MRKPAWERFCEKISYQARCVVWTGRPTKKGYGQFWAGAPILSHRFAYEVLVGPLPEGWDLHHLCENKKCVLPWHLKPLPHGEHARLPMPQGYRSSNEQKTHCPRGHKYDQRNTGVDNRGSRYCRACARDKARERRITQRGGDPQPTHYNRRKTHCPQGHPFDEANTAWTPNGTRLCLECRRAQAREYWRRKNRQER